MATQPSNPAPGSRVIVRVAALRLDALSDDRLVVRVRAGDDRAFEALFRRHHAPLLSFCRHMLGDRDEAEDAVQQAFIRALAAIRRGDRPRQPRAWLYTIARNRCRTLLARRRDLPAVEALDGAATEGLADAVQQRADLRAVLDDLQRLPEQQRAALLLAEIGQHTHQEIAEIVGCPRPKVKALVFQARAALVAQRDARDTSCVEIRETLSTATGGVLRRGPLRRHLRDCAGCRDFGAAVAGQRAAFSLLLPVVPTAAFGAQVTAASAAGAGAVTAAGAGGAVTASGAGAATLAAGGGKALAVKALAAAALVGGGGTATTVAVTHDPAPSAPIASAHARPAVPPPVSAGLVAAARPGSPTSGPSAPTTEARPAAGRAGAPRAAEPGGSARDRYGSLPRRAEQRRSRAAERLRLPGAASDRRGEQRRLRRAEPGRGAELRRLRRDEPRHGGAQRRLHAEPVRRPPTARRHPPSGPAEQGRRRAPQSFPRSGAAPRARRRQPVRSSEPVPSERPASPKSTPAARRPVRPRRDPPHPRPPRGRPAPAPVPAAPAPAARLPALANPASAMP